MDAVWVIGVGLLLAATLAGTLLFVSALHIGIGDQWRRFPRDDRRRGVFGGAVTAVIIAAALILVIVAPWGSRTLFYVVVVGFGTLMLLSLALVAVGAVRESRRARRRHD